MFLPLDSLVQLKRHRHIRSTVPEIEVTDELDQPIEYRSTTIKELLAFNKAEHPDLEQQLGTETTYDYHSLHRN